MQEIYTNRFILQREKISFVVGRPIARIVKISTVALFVVGIVLVGPSFSYAVGEEYPQIVSRSSEENAISIWPTISEDGRYIAFYSEATDLVPNDANGFADIFVFDRETEITERVSVASDGSEGNAHVEQDPTASISADGRYVAFVSPATNLVPNDTNEVCFTSECRPAKDVFVHDRATSITERVSVAPDGSQFNRDSSRAFISASGQYVTFTTKAANDGGPEAYVHDRVTGITEKITTAQGLQGVDLPTISADGRYVAFSSHASNLVPNDTNGTRDIFVHDRVTGTNERVSVTSDGIQSENGGGGTPYISADGRYVTFESGASDLVPGDSNGEADVFVHDRITGVTERVNVSSSAGQGNKRSGPHSRGKSSISNDGRYVVFWSEATNLVANDTNGWGDTFIHDRMTGLTERVSVASDGSQANWHAWFTPVISADGRYIAFDSGATNLVASTTNGTLFVDVTPHNVYITRNPFFPTNQAPIFGLIGNQTVDEGAPLQFTLTATDPDAGDVVTLSANSLPAGASFDSETGAFSWIPDFDDAGEYSVEFVATDDGDPVMSDSETISITVNDVNRAPVLNTIGDKSVTEGGLLQFTISATDPDLDAITYSAANLPVGASFDPQTASFSWTPGFNQAGNYENVEFTATDDGSPMELDVELITITVGNVNRAPVFDTLGAQEVLEEATLAFTVSATDPDDDTFTLSAQNLPAGASFTPATGAFSWTPTLAQSGSYVVTFEATDTGSPIEVGTLEVSITVGDNPTPVEQTETIIETITTYDFPTNIENSYMANLKKVVKFIEEGKIQPAINQINAFIDKVEDDFQGGDITQAERDVLIGLAQGLLADLE